MVESTITKTKSLIMNHQRKYTKIEELKKQWVELEDPGDVFSMAYDKDGRYLAVGLSDGAIKVLNTTTGKSITRVYNDFNYYEPEEGEEDAPLRNKINSIRWRSKTKIQGQETLMSHVVVCSTSDSEIQYWDPFKKKNLFRFKVEQTIDSKSKAASADHDNNAVNTIDFNNDNKLAAAGTDSNIRIYDESTEGKDLLMTMHSNGHKMHGHSNRIFCCKFDPSNDNVLYSGGWDDIILINDLREGGPVNKILGPHICGEAIDLQGNLLLVGSQRYKNALQIFDLRNSTKPPQDMFLTPKATVKNHYKTDLMINTCKWYQGQEMIICGTSGAQNQVKIFEANHQEMMKNSKELIEEDFPVYGETYSIEGHSKSIRCLTFSPSGNQFAYGTGDGLVVQCEVALKK